MFASQHCAVLHDVEIRVMTQPLCSANDPSQASCRLRAGQSHCADPCALAADLQCSRARRAMQDAPLIDQAAECVDCAADITWCTVCACMQTQARYEMNENQRWIGGGGGGPQMVCSRFHSTAERPIRTRMHCPFALHTVAHGHKCNCGLAADDATVQMMPLHGSYIQFRVTIGNVLNVSVRCRRRHRSSTWRTLEAATQGRSRCSRRSRSGCTTQAAAPRHRPATLPRRRATHPAPARRRRLRATQALARAASAKP